MVAKLLVALVPLLLELLVPLSIHMTTTLVAIVRIVAVSAITASVMMLLLLVPVVAIVAFVRRWLLLGGAATVRARLNGEVFAFLDAEGVTKVLFDHVGGDSLLHVALVVAASRNGGSSLKFLSFEKLDNNSAKFAIVLLLKLALSIC